MSVFLRGRTYWIRRMIKRKSYERSLHVRSGQEILLSEAVRLKELEITAEALGIPYQPPTRIAFDVYVEHYLKQEEGQVGQDRWEKKKRYLTIVAEIWRSAALDEIDRDAVSRVEKHLLEDRKMMEPTCNRYFEVLQHLFSRAQEEGHVRENPIKLFYKPFREEATRRALSADEIVKVLAAAAAVQRDPHGQTQEHIYDLCLVGLHTGARLSELLSLRHEHVRDSVAYLPIGSTKSRRRSPKRMAARIKPIILDPAAAGVVARLRALGDGFVFPVRRHPNAPFHAIRRIREISGVKDFVFHSLRHTFITMASEKSDVSKAQSLVGHADLKTTSRYTHPRLAEMVSLSLKLGAGLPGDEFKKKDGD